MAAQEKPTSPRTTAEYLIDWMHRRAENGADLVHALGLLERVEREAAAATPSLDFDSASALLSAYNYWLNDHPDATVGDRYDWTKRYLARLDEGSATPTENDDE